MRPKYASPGFRAFLATSFLGAFNDNFFKLIVVCFALSRLGKAAQDTYVPLAGAMFVLPYLVLSSYAGYVSDRFAKRQVIIWAKWAELAIMLLGVALFAGSAVYLLLGVLFLMGAQSAFYSPAKYGYLPETLPDRELPNGNGLTQLCTFIAIIAGSWMGGLIARLHASNWTLGASYCALAAALGIATAHFTGATPGGNPRALFSWNPLHSHWTTFKSIRRNSILLASMIGNSFFWFVAALFQNNLPLLVKQEMGAGEQTLGFLLGAVGLGIGFGCLACGALSRGRIAYRLILPGGLATAFAALFMGVFGRFLWAGLLFSAALGFFAGIYQLPLATSVQKHSAASNRGRCLALGNAMDCVGLLLAYIAQWLMLNLLRLSPSGVFIGLAVLTFAGVAALAVWTPFLRQPPRD